jgi:hypothetical protein
MNWIFLCTLLHTKNCNKNSKESFLPLGGMGYMDQFININKKQLLFIPCESNGPQLYDGGMKIHFSIFYHVYTFFLPFKRLRYIFMYNKVTFFFFLMFPVYFSYCRLKGPYRNMVADLNMMKNIVVPVLVQKRYI